MSSTAGTHAYGDRPARPSGRDRDRDDRQPSRQRAWPGPAGGPRPRHRGGGRRSDGERHRAGGGGPRLHRRCRYQRVRQAAARAVSAGCARCDRSLPQAGRRGDPGGRARRRSRSRARLPWSRRGAGRLSGPARGQAGTHPRRGWHAAAAAADRGGEGVPDDALGRARQRRQGAGARAGRCGDGRGSCRGRRRAGAHAGEPGRAAAPQREPVKADGGRSCGLRGAGRGCDEEVGGSAQRCGLDRGRARRLRAELRGGARGRAGALPEARRRSALGCAAPCLLRGTRHRPGARHRRRGEAAPDREGGGDRRRYDGRRHRHVLRQCGHPGDADRAGTGADRQRHEPGGGDLRDVGDARLADAGETRRAPGPDHARGRSRGRRRSRHRDRGRFRGDGRQAADLRRARRHRKIRRDPRQQHLLSRRAHHRGGDEALAGRAGDAFLQPGQCDEARTRW